MANSIRDVLRYDPKWEINSLADLRLSGMRFNLEQMIEEYVFQKMEQIRFIESVSERERRYQARKTYEENDYH
jgi:hypothetical protein